LVGTKVLFFATPQLSQGTKFVKNKLRMLGSINGVNADEYDLVTLYVAKFGNPTAGDNIVLGAKVINDNGQSSPMQTLKVSVVA